MGFVVPPTGYFAEINAGFSGAAPSPDRILALGSCYSGLPYYSKPEEKIASAVGSILKGHFFIDGNKRTALFAYILLCRLNGLKNIEDEDALVEIMTGSAAARWDIEELEKRLFPGQGDL
ncbi:MAG: Fic family protein [Desulfovibrio sp.]|nr:Fic family protein [Desulfovibrio sp.]